MKGLILSGGKGTRLRPLTFTRAKQLIPIANKPNLFYVIEDLVDAGITEMGIIISPETGDEIRQAVGDGSRWGAEVTFIPQSEPLGLAHAVMTARDYLGDDPFVMYLGDNLLSGGIADLVGEYERGGVDSIVLLIGVDNPRQFGVAELSADGQIVRLVEKPENPPSNLALVGVYLFGPSIHDANDTLQPSWRGEYEITDAIQKLVEMGKTVRPHTVRGWWKDTGKPEDLLEANRLVLSNVERDCQGERTNAEVVGQVVIEPGATVVDSMIRGPAHIAAGAEIRNTFIGPYTSVGPDVKVLNSEVEYSILLQAAELRDLPSRLDASVIGQGVIVDGRGDGLRRHSMQLVLGDHSHVKLR
jgi:glucose-1-phosphate thymidylyltransferase